MNRGVLPGPRGGLTGAPLGKPPRSWAEPWSVKILRAVKLTHKRVGDFGGRTEAFFAQAVVASTRLVSDHRPVRVNFAKRALARLLTEPELRLALDTLYRLEGSVAVRSFVSTLGRTPRVKLTPEERQKRLKAGREARSQRLAQRAATELGKAWKRLKAAQAAVRRIEASVRKWTERVKYHKELGRLPEEETS